MKTEYQLGFLASYCCPSSHFKTSVSVFSYNLYFFKDNREKNSDLFLRENSRPATVNQLKNLEFKSPVNWMISSLVRLNELSCVSLDIV